jgi:hypothetical protein
MVKMLSFEHLMYSEARTVLRYARSFPPGYERKRIRQASDKGGLRVALIFWSQPLRDLSPSREEFESEQCWFDHRRARRNLVHGRQFPI